MTLAAQAAAAEIHVGPSLALPTSLPRQAHNDKAPSEGRFVEKV